MNNGEIIAALTRVIAIRRAMTLRDIPEKYRGLPVIARGNTSIILDKDENTVVMLTRDVIKKDWLTFGS